MKRTGFSPKVYVRPPPQILRRLDQPVNVWRPTDDVAPIVKENALQHAGYMNIVRALPCDRCGHPPRSQFCHADEGKGLGIKTDVRRGWPGCAACHFLVGSTGALGREGRRLFELEAGQRTRAAIVAANLWPTSLPMWEGA